MGHTHHAYVPTGEIEEHVWEQLGEDIRAICNEGDWGGKDVFIEPTYIQVCGSCESFTLERVPTAWREHERKEGFTWMFTKTNQHPYDEFIVACYVSLKNHIPEVILKSDGDYYDLSLGLKRYGDTFDYEEAYEEAFYKEMYGE